MTLPPPLDSTGRSYGQVSQTPGALGGRRDVVQWYSTGGGLAPIAMTHDIGGATEWDISFPTLPGITNWTNVALPANQTHIRPRPICITKDLWFVANVSGFPYPAFGECNREMSRTKDGGATWDSISVGDETATTERPATGDEINHFARIVRDSAGRLWTARQIGSQTLHPIRTEVWYSDDDGDNWTLSTTLTQANGGRAPIALLTHPLNQNVIVLISSSRYAPTGGDNGIVIHYTTTRGNSWSTNEPTVASGDNFAHTINGQSSRHMILPNGRIVIANRETTSAHMEIYTSDNYGLTWQLRYTDTEVNEDNMLLFTQGQWLNLGVHLVGLRVPMQSGTVGVFAVLESIDGGNNWTERTTGDPPGAALSNNWDSVYDPVDDSIIAQNGDRNSPWTNRIVRLRNASNGGTTWDDITGDMPDPDTKRHWEGIALIPYGTGEGMVFTSQGMIVKVLGASWRIIVVNALIKGTSLSELTIDILAQVPGGSYESIFTVKPAIGIGNLISSGGILRGDRRILPIGTLVKPGSNVIIGDMTVELHYRTRAVSQ